MRQKFFTKCVRFFITNCNNFIINATIITKCDVYYKLRQYNIRIRNAVLYVYPQLLKIINFIDFTFSHVSSEKQTLLVGTHIKWEFKCDWVIRNNTAMTFALFNQSEEYKSSRKKRMCSKTKIVSHERKLIYKMEI